VTRHATPADAASPSRQLFKYTPAGAETGSLALVYESPSAGVLNAPDNICISPRGGIVVCEDGVGTNYVRGITPGGAVFDLARNNLNDSEWAAPVSHRAGAHCS